MDTVSQISLGAAVGEVVLGKKAGNKAPLWGAIGGTIPDLDVLLSPLVSEVQALAIHRGFSHSIFFAMLFAPLLGWIIHRIHSGMDVSWREWGWLSFWCIITHPLLDAFTVYGTQLFNPISDYPVMWGSLFIIDPLYTLPLSIGVLLALNMNRQSDRRRLVNMIGLGFSVFYLMFSMGAKWHAEAKIETALEAQNISHERFFATAAPLNTILWNGVAEGNDSLWFAQYSLFDGDGPITITGKPKNSAFIAPYRDQLAIRRLLWFSHGYYHARRENGALYFDDVRFGRSDLYLESEGQHIFSFRLVFDADDPTKIKTFRQVRPGLNFENDLLSRYWQRIWGNRSLTVHSGNPN